MSLKCFCDSCDTEIPEECRQIIVCVYNQTRSPSNQEHVHMCYSCQYQCLPKDLLRNFPSDFKVTTVPKCIQAERDRCELLVLQKRDNYVGNSEDVKEYLTELAEELRNDPRCNA